MKNALYDFLAGGIFLLAVCFLGALFMSIESDLSNYPLIGAMYLIAILKIALPILGIFTFGKLIRKAYFKVFKKVSNV